MDKNKLKYIVNLGLIATFFTSLTTGLIKFPGLLQFFHVSKGSLPIVEINFIHEWSGIFMSFLVLTHLMLNWKWLVEMTKRILRNR
jgi:hypothetical protein